MFPSIHVPSGKDKIKEWSSAWGNAIVQQQDTSLNSRMLRIHSNNQLYMGLIDGKEFEYITKQYGLRTPARLVGYPFAYRLVEELVGESSKDSLEFSVQSVDQDIITAKLEKKVEAAAHVLTKPIREILGGISVEEMFADGTSELPDSLQAFHEMSFHDHVEVGMMYCMSHLQTKQDWDLKFTEGMREMAKNYTEIYRCYVKNGDPFFEVVNPSSVSFGHVEGLRWLQDAPWVKQDVEVPIFQLIDEFRHVVDAATVQKWEKWAGSVRTNVNQFISEWGMFGRYDENQRHLYLRVVRYEWLAIATLRVKVSSNKWDPEMPFYKFVSDTASSNKNYEFNQAWQGVFIAGEHFDQRPKADQVRHNSDYAKTHLSYFGCVRPGLSIIDLTKNLILFLSVVMFHIESMLNRAGGKAVVYDMAQKPSNVPLKDVFYHAKESGLILVNSAEEKAQRGRGFNQFQQIDFTLSSSIDQLFRLKQMLEETMLSISGVNVNRLGGGHHEETVKNNQQKITQSTYITQAMSDDHFKVVEDVMNEMLNLVKIAWADDSDRVLMVMGDRGRETVKFMKDWLGHHYGLYVKNSQKERLKKENLVMKGNQALSAGQLDFISMVKIENASNSKEVERLFIKGIDAMKKSQSENAQAANAAKMEEFKLKREEIQSRITAARIEAGAYVEVKRLEIMANVDLKDTEMIGKLAEVSEQSRAALDQIVVEARAKAAQEQPTEPQGQEGAPKA